MSQVTSWFGGVRKASLLEFLDNFFGARYIDAARGKIVSAMNGFVTRYFDKCDCFCVSRFKADGSAGRNVQAEAICPTSVEL